MLQIAALLCLVVGGIALTPDQCYNTAEKCWYAVPDCAKPNVYKGAQAKTRSGHECQNWSSDSPHAHSIHQFNDNKCRNPDSEIGGPWCYTTNKRVRYEYCFNACTGPPPPPKATCPDGWKEWNDMCYKMFPQNVFQNQAEIICQKHGAHLASIHSAAENNFAAAQFKKEHVAAAKNGWICEWIGLSDVAVEKAFQWTDGSLHSYALWSKGQPDNGGNEDCVALCHNLPGNKWNDFPCWYRGNWKFPFLCKRAKKD